MTHILTALINGRPTTLQGTEADLTTKLVRLLHRAYPAKSGFACIPETYSIGDIALAVEEESLGDFVSFVIRERDEAGPVSHLPRRTF